MAKATITDQYIDSASGQFHFVVEDAHGTRSEHVVMLGAPNTPNVQAVIAQTLADCDARTTAIDSLAHSLGVRVE